MLRLIHGHHSIDDALHVQFFPILDSGMLKSLLIFQNLCLTRKPKLVCRYGNQNRYPLIQRKDCATWFYLIHSCKSVLEVKPDLHDLHPAAFYIA
jgi:hypothetical protein